MEALEQFKSSLKMAEELLAIEKTHYHNPPRSSEQKAVAGLRSGAAILSVAAFENFLKSLIEEQLGEMKPRISLSNFSKLPDDLRSNSVFKTLEYAMKGPRYQVPLPRVDRLFAIHQACTNVIAGIIDPEVFCDVSSNPNSRNVKALFKDVDLDNIFQIIRPKFDHKWKSVQADHFIELKLDEIVNRRHQVAHGSDALHITRKDLKESIRFLNILASVLDANMKDHIKQVIRTCC